MGFLGSEDLIERQLHGLNGNANNAIDDCLIDESPES